MIVRFLDWQARKIQDWCTPKRLMRLAVVMLDVSFAFAAYTPFSNDPPWTYTMSWLALFFAAVIAVAAAVREKKDEADK
jgi:hypothetical protein